MEQVLTFTDSSTGSLSITNPIISPNVALATGCISFDINWDSKFIWKSDSSLVLNLGNDFGKEYDCQIKDGSGSINFNF